MAAEKGDCMTEVYLYYNATQHGGLYGAVATTIEWPYYGGSTVLLSSEDMSIRCILFITDNGHSMPVYWYGTGNDIPQHFACLNETTYSKLLSKMINNGIMPLRI